MPKNYSYTLEVEDDMVIIRAAGQDSFEATRDMITAAADLCRKHGVKKILGLSSMSKISVSEAIDHQIIFKEARLDSSYVIAWADTDPEAQRMNELVGDILVNRNMASGRVFGDWDEAKKWLKSI